MSLVDIPTWRALLAGTSLSVTDARRIMQETTGRHGAEWVLALDSVPSSCEVVRFSEMVSRRESGEPLQYVLGRWAFRGLDLAVEPGALIPRPETEVVVEIALGELASFRSTLPSSRAASSRLPRLLASSPSPGASPLPPRLLASSPSPGASPLPPRLLAADLGTGSGAIALCLAVEGGAETWATDLSEPALELARRNLTDVAPPVPVKLSKGSWYEALPRSLHGQLHLIVSNPPYISDGELRSLDPAVSAFEPHAALVAGPTGLEALQQVIEGAPEWLLPGGSLVVEIAPHQSSAVTYLAHDAGFEAIEIFADLSGRDRCLRARSPR